MGKQIEVTADLALIKLLAPLKADVSEALKPWEALSMGASLDIRILGVPASLLDNQGNWVNGLSGDWHSISNKRDACFSRYHLMQVDQMVRSSIPGVYASLFESHKKDPDNKDLFSLEGSRPLHSEALGHSPLWTPFFGGQSGGPAFDREGNIIGLVSRSWPVVVGKKKFYMNVIQCFTAPVLSWIHRITNPESVGEESALNQGMAASADLDKPTAAIDSREVKIAK